MKEYKVIVDTREKKPWTWEYAESKKFRCIGTVSKGLDCGDYSIEGLEDTVRIERKAGFRELFTNYSPKAHKERFEREMEKLSKIPYAYVIIESTLSEDSLSLSVPQMKYGPPGSRVLRWILDMEKEHGVSFIFAGDAGERICRYIFEDIIQKHG